MLDYLTRGGGAGSRLFGAGLRGYPAIQGDAYVGTA